MSFIASSSTVTVQAFLTAAGRRKLFDSIETVNEPFVTKFALGDSDANYGAIESGFGTLAAGHVPEPGEFRSNIRSFALFQGRFRPSVSHIVVDGRYGGSEGHFRTFPIGDNVESAQAYSVESEWPKGEKYNEEYFVSANLAGTDLIRPIGATPVDVFNNGAIFLSFQNNELRLSFEGGLSTSELQNIIGPDNETNNGWTLEVRIQGQESQAQTVLDIDFVQ